MIIISLYHIFSSLEIIFGSIMDRSKTVSVEKLTQWPCLAIKGLIVLVSSLDQPAPIVY